MWEPHRFSLYSFARDGDHRDLPSFPTRRSSDLGWGVVYGYGIEPHTPHDGYGDNSAGVLKVNAGLALDQCGRELLETGRGLKLDRKSTRLNSSHSQISYAVFCLKKKKNSNLPDR